MTHNNATQSKHNALDTVPAIDIELHGQHLIEASAGTGKTWTLTGIVLRLLIEKKAPPEKIICTTFTRAAAAEMRQRIHERLTDFYQLLQWLSQLRDDTNNHNWLYPQLSVDNKIAVDEKSKPADKDTQNLYQEYQQKRQQNFIEKANGEHIKELLEDKVNLHLLQFICDNVANYSLQEAMHRTTNLMTTLDKLFVSTLDSLAQKWLVEYSTETGHQKGTQISSDDAQIVQMIVHDAVRSFQSHLHHSNKPLFDIMQQTNQLPDIADYQHAIDKALKFYSSPIDDVTIPDFGFKQFDDVLNRIKQHDCTDLQPYYDDEFRKKEKMSSRAVISKNIRCVANIFDAVKQFSAIYFNKLDDKSVKYLTELHNFFETGKGFNKGSEANQQAFANLQSIQLLKTLKKVTDNLTAYIQSTLDNLLITVVNRVKTELPILLENKNETTFSLQMLKLIEALKNDGSQQLAKHIRHQYPIALIDESQDIDTAQAKLIELIYLNKHTKNNKQNFLLLVGDPKQAIYGFRGGDVNNYNQLKRQFNSVMSLSVNFRSSQSLIDGLNIWFGCANNDAINDSNISADGTQAKQQINKQLASLGDDIYYHHITAKNQHSELVWQTERQADDDNKNLPKQRVSVLHIPYDKEQPDEIQTVAQYIKTLLSQRHMLKDKPLNAGDIAVLSRNHKNLAAMQYQLNKLDIANVLSAEHSIFASLVAKELFILIQAMINPFDITRVRRTLLGIFYGLSIQDVDALCEDNSMDNVGNTNNLTLADDAQNQFLMFQQFLKKARELWSSKGLLTALELLLSHQNSFNETSVWQKIATYTEAQRYLIDLRSMLDVLAQHASQFDPKELSLWLQKHLSQKTKEDWALQQPLPTQSGVQLMTIHKSKGLEFPIVFVLGINASAASVSSQKNTLFLYTKQPTLANIPNHVSANLQTMDVKPASQLSSQLTSQVNSMQRRLTTNADLLVESNPKPKTVKQSVLQEEIGELKRLIYVALTRASEQVFMVVSDLSAKRQLSERPLNFWLDCLDSKEYSLPERLQTDIGWIQQQDVLEASQNVSNQQYTLTLLDRHSDEQETIDYVAYDNYDQVIKTKRFAGWARTSFSAIAHQIDDKHNEADMSEGELDALETNMLSNGFSQRDVTAEIDDTKNNAINILDNQDIRFNFIKGANAGSFLHKIFEKIDFTNQSTWQHTIQQAAYEFAIPEKYIAVIKNNAVTSNTDLSEYEKLTHWLADILNSTLTASGQCLADIDASKRFPELGFNMGLSVNFEIQKINQLFKKYCAEDNDKYINLINKIGADGKLLKYKFLRGEIDLVYQHGQKFYVVDYKSNYVGDKIEDYHHDNLNKVMNKAGYWLQALIYQVALHRLLSVRIKDYIGQEDKYLGAVEYVFLRGCVADKHAQQPSSYGKISWNIPIDMVKEMDKLLGKANI